MSQSFHAPPIVTTFIDADVTTITRDSLVATDNDRSVEDIFISTKKKARYRFKLRGRQKIESKNVSHLVMDEN